jgi:CRISPR system Cascade subunit CasD
MLANTLYLRLEGPLQAWGSHESKFAVRRTMDAPSKSAVVGLLCAAMGVSRPSARDELARLSAMQMGVRVDRPGIRWWDYHTVGAGMQMRIAERDDKTKSGALLSRREYLCDASFLVALHGHPQLVASLQDAVANPHWTVYLGRKSCPPSRPIIEREADERGGVLEALQSVPWRRRLKDDAPPDRLECLLDWAPTSDQPEAPDDALVWYDVPVSLEPPAHEARFVVRTYLSVGSDGGVGVDTGPAVSATPRPVRPRANYRDTRYREVRSQRLGHDEHLCVFCKSPATTVQHVTYRHAGGDESLKELRSLCRLCHDAVTMLEYGAGMGLDRIDPEDPSWRVRIIAKRGQILRYRSLETRRRRLNAEEVE